MKIILDCIFILVILGCLWAGYKKGLISSIVLVLSLIISIYMGNLLSDTFSHEASSVVKPFISGYMEGSTGAIEGALKSLVDSSELELSTNDILIKHPEIKEQLCEISFLKMGVYPSTAAVLAKRAVDEHNHDGGLINDAIVDTYCDSLCYYVGFILFFSLSLIILTAFVNLFNLSFKLPNLNLLNLVGGLVFSFFAGLIFCCILAWMLKFLGLFLPPDTAGSGLFTQIFVKLNNLSSFLFI